MTPWIWLLFGVTAVACASCAAGAASGTGASGAAGVAGASGDAAPPSSRPRDPIDSPEAAVTTYFRASDTASSRLLRAAFDPASHMQWVDETGAPRLLTQAEWWLRTDATATPTPATERRLEVLDREGSFALIEAISTWPTHTFDDLLLVARLPTGWQIVGKLYERLAPGATTAADPADEAQVRDVIAQKIEAHAAYDPALLSRSHTPLCLYVTLHAPAAPFQIGSLSQVAAAYASRREAGETDRASPWQVLKVVVRGRIAAVKTDVIYKGKRYIDHLLLLKTRDGWKIAAVSWGDPTVEPTAG
jgi:hypothetical protein